MVSTMTLQRVGAQHLLACALLSGVALIASGATLEVPGDPGHSDRTSGDAGSEASATDGPASASPLRLGLRGQTLLYGTFLSPASPSRFNPDNRLAMIPERQANTELRIDLSATVAGCSISAKLRGQYNRTINVGSIANSAESGDGFMNTGGIRCRTERHFEFSVGREVLQWGSSIFLSPSNPFFIETGKTNPIQELYGKDTWQASWYPDDKLTVTAMRNYRQGRLEPAPNNFSPASAVKIDWIGADASGGAILSHRDNGVNRLGLYGTYPYSKALLLYTDASGGRGNAGRFPIKGNTGNGLDWRFEQSKLNSRAFFYSVLLGGAYTFESGWSLTTELTSGNEGYNNTERTAYQAAATQASHAFLDNGLSTASAAQLLSTALAPNLPYLSRNYLFLQLLRSEWNDKADVAIRWVRSMDSVGGSLISGSFTYYAASNLQVFLLVSHASGGDGSDFGRLIRNSLQAGIRTYF